jgi:shikimate dehydrogenase
VIHNAGYAAAGLAGWSYTAIECTESGLAGVVGGLGDDWVGLSLTMPLKEAALAVADLVDPFAAAVGAANTLVRRSDGWRAYNTDVPGLVQALRQHGVTEAGSVAVLGGGGTARAAIAAAASLSAPVTVYARRPSAVDDVRSTAEALGVSLIGASWADAERATGADLVVSTVPKGVADPLAAAGWRAGTFVFDVVYDPWPTALAAAAENAGATVISGLDLLLWQAVYQFELFTGATAPVEAMRAALDAAVGGQVSA